MYFINEPAFKRPVSIKDSLESKTLGPNVAKENIRSGSFSIIPSILNLDLPKLIISPTLIPSWFFKDLSIKIFFVFFLVFKDSLSS